MNQGILEPVGWVAPWGRLMRQLHRITGLTPRQVGTVSAGHQQQAFPIRPVARALSPSVTPRAASAHAMRHQPRSPLRVIRVVEAGQASALAGRILMSGRMADVCAELDRMVEREAAMRISA